MRIFLLATPLLLLGSATAMPDDRPPPPYTEEQIQQLRDLVQTTRATGAKLQTAVEEKQRELAGLYNQYELNERAAPRLQQEIVDLQQQLLANHHKMQKELRAIVSKERFSVLSQRLNRAMAPKEKPPERPGPR
jgi:hypothetical protein